MIAILIIIFHLINFYVQYFILSFIAYSLSLTILTINLIAIAVH